MSEVILADLNLRHYGVSAGCALAYAEAARVCLDRHHVPPTLLDLQNNGESTEVICRWAIPDKALKAAWNNRDDATRDGAYGLSLAAVEKARGLVAIGRAETKTGADYYVAEPGQTMDDLEEATRLEVSGIDVGNSGAVGTRLNQKLAQARRGASNLPAIASVVGFSAALIIVADVV